MEDQQRHLAVLGFAVHHAAEQPGYVSAKVRDDLVKIVKDALGDAAADGPGIERWDRGEVLFLAPPSVTPSLATTFVWALELGLRQHNKQLTRLFQICIRVALASGNCQRDGDAWLGDPINDVRRMLRSPLLDDQRTAGRDVPMSFIASNEVYSTYIRGQRLGDEDAFRPVTLSRRGGDAQPAWIRDPRYRPDTEPRHPHPPAPKPKPSPDVTLATLDGGKRRTPGRVDIPDTVADGWSTDHFDVRYATVRGDARRNVGHRRLDGVAVAQHHASGALVFALSDGGPARPSGQITSTAGCEGVVEALLSGLDAEADQVDWPGAVGPTAGPMLAGLVRPTAHGLMAWLVQTGEGGVWTRRDGVYQHLHIESAEADDHEVEPGFELVVTGPLDEPDLTPRVLYLDPGDVLMVGTRGVRDLVGPKPDKLEESALLGLTPLDFALGLRFGAESFAEDRSLITVRVKPAS